MGKLRNLALILFVAVFITACGAGGAGTNVTVSDVGNVEGTVTGSSSSVALSGVTVQIGDKTAPTGTNGVYSIIGLAVGSRTITATKSGYQDYNGTVTVTKGTTVIQNIQMTLAGTSDTTPPTVSSVDPASNATDVAVNKAVTVTFSEAMDCSTITTSTFTLKDNLNTTVAGDISTCNNTTAVFTPSSNLSYSTLYTATLTTGIKDSAGNTMASNYSWSYTTGTAPDTTPPTVSSTTPVNSATAIAVNTAITATFSEAMTASTISTATFTLNNGVTGTVTYSGTTATFTPSSNLAYSTTYTATITTGVKDSAGNTMASNYTWTFTTGTATAATGKMPDTNQTTSYTNTFGEDHDYSINAPSYTDNGNGTVTDNVTGLVWQKQDDATTRTWADAGTYCDASTLGGYADWRLPSQMELISIIDNGTYSPTINATFFPSTISSDYWSSTTGAENTSYAWIVDFGYGNSDSFYNTNSHYVRCVRGVQNTPSLTDNGNGTVTDSSTLLTWQKAESSTMTWEAALSYCEGLSMAGSTDWRLPNHKELLSLADYTRYNPSINTTLFPSAISSFYWSSTTVANYTASAWFVHFGGGGSNRYDKTVSCYARCVQGGQ